MAIFSNFEGTLKDSITIGKGANKFTMSADAASNTISFVSPSGRAQLEVGTPSNNFEVANKTYIDSKLSLTGTAAPTMKVLHRVTESSTITSRHLTVKIQLVVILVLTLTAKLIQPNYQV